MYRRTELKICRAVSRLIVNLVYQRFQIEEYSKKVTANSDSWNISLVANTLLCWIILFSSTRLWRNVFLGGSVLTQFVRENFNVRLLNCLSNLGLWKNDFSSKMKRKIWHWTAGSWNSVSVTTLCKPTWSFFKSLLRLCEGNREIVHIFTFLLLCSNFTREQGFHT